MQSTKAEQTELLLISDAGNVAPNLEFTDQEKDGRSVDVISRAIGLQNITSMMLEAEVMGRVTGKAKIVSNAREKAIRLRLGAQSMFHDISGSPQLLDTGDVGLFAMENAGATASQLFADFISNYFSAAATENPYQLKNTLSAEVLIMQMVEGLDQQMYQQSAQNREQNLRPHKSNSARKKDLVETLDTPGRLQALLDDSRANHYPTTRSEITKSVSYLDYLDNPKFPLRLTNRFIEIYNFTEWINRRSGTLDSDPKRGPESIVYELWDHYQDAVKSRKNLTDLQGLIYECLNQRITLGEETDVVPIDHPGYPAFIRFLDIRSFHQTGSGIVVADPLVTKTYRWEEDRKKPGKHKMIGDIYNLQFMTPELRLMIRQSVEGMNVGYARKNIGDAVRDQFFRESYLRLILSKFAFPLPDTPPTLLKELEKPIDAAKAVLSLAA